MRRVPTRGEEHPGEYECEPSDTGGDEECEPISRPGHEQTHDRTDQRIREIEEGGVGGHRRTTLSIADPVDRHDHQ